MSSLIIPCGQIETAYVTATWYHVVKRSVAVAGDCACVPVVSLVIKNTVMRKKLEM